MRYGVRSQAASRARRGRGRGRRCRPPAGRPRGRSAARQPARRAADRGLGPLPSPTCPARPLATVAPCPALSIASDAAAAPEVLARISAAASRLTPSHTVAPIRCVFLRAPLAAPRRGADVCSSTERSRYAAGARWRHQSNWVLARRTACPPRITAAIRPALLRLAWRPPAVHRCAMPPRHRHAPWRAAESAVGGSSPLRRWTVSTATPSDAVDGGPAPTRARDSRVRVSDLTADGRL